MKGASHTVTTSVWLHLSEATKLRQEESEKVAVAEWVQTVSLTTWKSTGISAQQCASSRLSVLYALNTRQMGEVNSCFEVLDFRDWEGKFCFSGLVKAQHSQEEADWREGVSRSLPDSGSNACLLRTSWCACSLYYIGMEFPARPKSLWAKEAREQARHKSLSEHCDSLNQTVFAFLCL